MAVPILKYTLMIKTSIRSALKSGAISTHEAEYLHSMATNGDATTSTAALINGKGAPDFLYAALYLPPTYGLWARPSVATLTHVRVTSSRSFCCRRKRPHISHAGQRGYFGNFTTRTQIRCKHGSRRRRNGLYI